MQQLAEDVRAADSTLLSRRDLRFVLHEWLDVRALCERERFASHSPEVFDDVIELAERLATDRFATHGRRADEQEPEIRDGKVVLIEEIGAAVEAAAEAGFIGIAMDEAVGGLQFPYVIASACQAWFSAANMGTATYGVLATAAGNLLIDCATPEQVDRWVKPMVEGRFFATMAISETEAGSSVGDALTRAVPQADGTYRLFGSKMWIGAGDHEIGENIVHLVIARLPDAPAGSKGLSLFVVPKFLVGEDGARGERNDVTVAGINHKMGQRAAVNTVLGFGEGDHLPGGASGAVGYLVGAPGRGLNVMFHMMNEARIGTGLGAAAIGYTAYLKSVRYARERTQGRPVGAPPESKPVPIIEHADVRRMLLAQKAYVEGALALVLYCARLVDEAQTAATEEARAHAELLLGVLTPIAKSWPSQWCLEANNLAIQVHGGYGYARDYDVERLYRDNRVSSIYEGTTGIQALDLLGRKVLAGGGAGLAALLAAIGDTVARAKVAGGEAATHAAALETALERIGQVTAIIGRASGPDEALANATIYLEAVGHVVIAWIWLEQVLAAADRPGAFYDGKRAAARFFFRYELPRTAAQFDLLESLDRTTLDTQHTWL